jgi:hypothetical protein
VTCPRRAAAAAVACCLVPALALSAAACEAVLREHRSGTELARLPLDAAQPELRIAFEHSVLGTTVVDRYRFTPRPRLVEERFDGQGYGLPHAAGPGETLQRDGSGWRLVLDRAVDPLVVRPLPAQRMRIVLADRELPLATLSGAAIEIAAHGCPIRPAP